MRVDHLLQEGGIKKVFSFRSWISCRTAYQYTNIVRMLLYLIKSFIAFVDEICEFEKIAWRISANTELRKNSKVSPCLPGLIYTIYDFFDIPFEIADMIILLC